jgi:transketolase
VLPAGVPRVAVEAASSFGWDRWVGEGGAPSGAIVALDRFGASAPAPRLFRELGFTPENIAATARGVLAGCRGGCVEQTHD